MIGSTDTRSWSLRPQGLSHRRPQVPLLRDKEDRLPLSPTRRRSAFLREEQSHHTQENIRQVPPEEHPTKGKTVKVV